MTALLEFISSLVDGLALISLALVLGGLGCLLAVLRVMHDPRPILESGTRRVLAFTWVSAWLFLGFRLLQVILKPLALAHELGVPAFTTFAQTQVFRFSMASLLVSMVMLVMIRVVTHEVTSCGRWVGLFFTLIFFFSIEGWLSHAASRLKGGGPLMVVTMVHVLGATVWAGGIVHLLLLRREFRGADAKIWPELVSRFSPVGIVCVGVILVSGSFLTWQYVGEWSAFVGTGYGNMVLVKMVLFASVLVFATLNFLAARDPKGQESSKAMHQRVPAYIEVEIILAVALLFTAASLTGFPPSVDVVDDAASPSEIWEMFNPKMPRLAGPELVQIDAPELTDLRTGKIGKKDDWSWDRFNHNISGVIVMAMAIVALFDRLGGFRWARYWPLMFMGFSILIFVFANPDHWPLGPMGFLASLQETEVVQHWMAAGVVFGLGWFEWRARTHDLRHRQAEFVFPVLCIVGGIILLTHSHSITELKEEFLIQSTHVLMGVLGVLIGCGRWLEIRLPPPYDRLAGIISIVGMMLVGFILLFYVTPHLVE